MRREAAARLSSLAAAPPSARAALLAEAAVLARSREHQTAFVEAGLHALAVDYLSSPPPPDSAPEEFLATLAQAARLLGNLAAHQPRNKAAVVAARGVEALARACALGLEESRLEEPRAAAAAEGARALVVEAAYALGNVASGAEAREVCGGRGFEHCHTATAAWEGETIRSTQHAKNSLFESIHG
ncbi:hypothetical protein AB1Y20_011851 [Prymnesium parvum]|uniref:Uncharacterized protein n=1 Tax=Prymnesium parvum TaxID=97485 RepID=A0AB34IHP8_PRYPA